MPTNMKKLNEGTAAPPVIDAAPPPMAIEEKIVQAVLLGRLWLPVGRGRGGKTMQARYLIESLLRLGRKLIVADADRTNSTLANFYPGALQPESADETDVVALVRKVVETMVATGHSGLIDFGGGDLVLKRVAKDLDFQHWLREIGIEPVLLYMLGASQDDLAFMDSLEKNFAPPSTVVILNQAAVPAHVSPTVAFRETVQKSPVLHRVLERGGHLLVMPRLEPAPEIDARRMSFADAAANRPPADGREDLGIWRAQQTRLWLRAMDEEMATIREWL